MLDCQESSTQTMLKILGIDTGAKDGVGLRRNVPRPVQLCLHLSGTLQRCVYLGFVKDMLADSRGLLMEFVFNSIK